MIKNINYELGFRNKNSGKYLFGADGFSLVEILVVIVIFAVLGLLVTRSITLTLQGSQKSTSLVSARENLDYSLGVIERQLRNANSITCLNSSPTTEIYYFDQNDVLAYFQCVNPGNDNSSIASGSGSVSTHLTNNNIKVLSCSFSCINSTSGPSQVDIDISLQSVNSTGILGSVVSASTQVFLRNY